MRIGVVKENNKYINTVGLSPSVVSILVNKGAYVAVEVAAGQKAGFTDLMYINSGADLVTTNEAWNQEVVVKVSGPTQDELNLVSKKQKIISLYQTNDVQIANKLNDLHIDNIITTQETSKIQLKKISQLNNNICTSIYNRFQIDNKLKILILGSNDIGLKFLNMAIAKNYEVLIYEQDKKKNDALQSLYKFVPILDKETLIHNISNLEPNIIVNTNDSTELKDVIINYIINNKNIIDIVDLSQNEPYNIIKQYYNNYHNIENTINMIPKTTAIINGELILSILNNLEN